MSEANQLTPAQFAAQLAERKKAQQARGGVQRFNAFEMRLNPIKESVEEFARFCIETEPGQGIASLNYLKTFIDSQVENLKLEQERKKNERASQPAYEPTDND